MLTTDFALDFGQCLIKYSDIVYEYLKALPQTLLFVLPVCESCCPTPRPATRSLARTRQATPEL